MYLLLYSNLSFHNLPSPPLPPEMYSEGGGKGGRGGGNRGEGITGRTRTMNAAHCSFDA